jgi:hypothetical protein
VETGGDGDESDFFEDLQQLLPTNGGRARSIRSHKPTAPRRMPTPKEGLPSLSFLLGWPHLSELNGSNPAPPVSSKLRHFCGFTHRRVQTLLNPDESPHVHAGSSSALWERNPTGLIDIKGTRKFVREPVGSLARLRLVTRRSSIPSGSRSSSFSAWKALRRSGKLLRADESNYPAQLT